MSRSNFKEVTESSLQTGEKPQWARDHSSRTLDHQLKKYSQWFPGKENKVTDSLSRDDHISDNKITFILFSIIQQHIPLNFKISPLPPVIVSNLLAMLQRLPEATQQREARQQSRIMLGSVSKSFSNKSTSNTIPSSIRSPTNTKYTSSLTSPKPCANQNFSPTRFSSLVASIVRGTVDHMGSTSRDNFRRNPLLDEDGKPTRILQTQYKGYQNKNPNQKQQKAIPFCIIKQINANKSTEKEKATSQLITGTIFFVMSSCK